MRAPFELRQVDVFLILCEELSFARTAERTGLTPSRVSQTIRALEATMGGRLFERTSRRVAITPLGEQLRADMAPAYEQLQHAYAACRERATGVSTTLRVGMYLPINGGPHFAEIVDRFHEAHPGWRVQTLDTGYTEDPLEWLRRGDADVLAQRLPVTDPDFTVGTVLSREGRIALVAQHHPLAGRDSISYEDLADYPVTDQSTFSRELMNAFVPPRTPSGRLLKRRTRRTLADAMTLVAAGELVHPTVPSVLDYHRHPGLTSVPIHDLPPSETALVWLAGAASPLIEAFVRTAREVLRRYEASRTVPTA